MTPLSPIKTPDALPRIAPALFGMTLSELTAVTEELGLPRFAARQMASWLYKKQAVSIDDMTDISLNNREKIKNKYRMGIHPPLHEVVSTDGTKKYLFAVSYKDGLTVEAAFIPEKTRATLCLSSQVGCKMACAFCMTGRQGFQGNLSSGDILNQMRSLPECSRLTNLVYMGMGEPLDNLSEVMKSLEILTSDWGYGWAPKRITLSTIGILPALRTFLERSNCHLALSLHTPFDKERESLMPAQKVHPVHKVLEMIKNQDFNRQRRISFEYILLRGINDTPKHIKELARLLNGLRCRINLIRFHPIPDAPFASPDEQSIQDFRQALEDKGIIATIRQSRGMDIQAACGMLSTNTKKKKP